MDHTIISRQFAGRSIIVLGDVMLDRFVYGQAHRLSPEGPIPVLHIDREQAMLGGAANVARNITSLGGCAILIGAIGRDSAADELKALAAASGIVCNLIASEALHTTAKTRFVAQRQQLLRVDQENIAPIRHEALLAAFLERLPNCDSVVVSDYAKGVVSDALLREALAAARTARKPVIVDPKSKHLARYDGAAVLTPNRAEAAAAADLPCDTDDQAIEVCKVLLQRAPNISAILVTRGPQGMTLAPRDQPAVHIRATAREVFDVSGAGDTVAAALALGMATGAPLDSVASIANAAAGISVSKPGTAVVSADELAKALRTERIFEIERKAVSIDVAAAVVADWRASGQRIGFTNGCFDLLHRGHISLLFQARAACDRLVVGLNSDRSVRRLKGNPRPLQTEEARAMVLASLSTVDLVVIFDEDTPIGLIKALRPDILIKGADYAVDQVVGAKTVAAYGGKILLADLVPNHSTSSTIRRMYRKEG